MLPRLTPRERKDVLRIVLCGLLLVIPPLVYAWWESQVIACGGRGPEKSAAYALRALHAGQARFRREDWDRDGVPDYASLAELDACGAAEVRFGEHRARQGYLFEVWRSPGPVHTWWGKASPAAPGTTGDWYFYIDHEGALYASRSDFPLPLEEESDELIRRGGP